MSRRRRYAAVSPHWQCECGNAGWKGRLCDLCGTPFEWLPSADDWEAFGPLPGEEEEHRAEVAAMREEEGLRGGT